MTPRIAELSSTDTPATLKCGVVRLGFVMLAASALVACGGGAGMPAIESPQEPSQGAVSTPKVAAIPIVIDALVDSQDSFSFAPKAAYTDVVRLAQDTGGDIFTAWNPSNPRTALAPGMKVLFFGKAGGCPGAQDQGPVAVGADTEYAIALQRAGLPGIVAGGHRWVPSANTDACDTSLRSQTGASMAQLNADDAAGAAGALGLYTAAAPDSGFLRPYDAAGQDGHGASAYITGTFVGFRQAWWGADPLQPWLAANGEGSARIVSTQSVTSAYTDDAADAAHFTQVKQQISVTFLNTECAKSGTTAARPCQVEYLLNTAMYRTAVTDWSTQSWAQYSDVFFDPAQGGIPVVNGAIPAAGSQALDKDNQLPLWTSRGAATQHTTFGDQNFDVRISFEQLQNALKIVAARKADIRLDALSTDQLASVWGARWNDSAAWVLLSVNVGQEVYNPYAERSAYIGGAFKRLYVGRTAF